MDDFNKIKDWAECMSLSAGEKAQIRGNILHAVRNEKKPRLILHMSYALYLALFLSLGLGSAASFGAQGALPGDPLYVVKTAVNEKVEEALSFTPEAKAQFEAKVSEVRLDEAQKLAEKNRFNGTARANIEANFNIHAENVQNRINELEKKGKSKLAADLSVKFEKSLEAHAKILEKLDGEEMVKFLPGINNKKNAAAALRLSNASSASSTEINSAPPKRAINAGDGEEGEEDGPGILHRLFDN